jgi:hypothetical protein
MLTNEERYRLINLTSAKKRQNLLDTIAELPQDGDEYDENDCFIASGLIQEFEDMLLTQKLHSKQ